MKIGVPNETYHPGERRVATTPAVARELQKLGFDVIVEQGPAPTRASPTPPTATRVAPSPRAATRSGTTPTSC